MENLEKLQEDPNENNLEDMDTPDRVNLRSEIKARVIKLNASNQDEKFAGNRISTAKYSFWSFVPSFLFEQFRRYSNVFFLLIALLQVSHKLFR